MDNKYFKSKTSRYLEVELKMIKLLIVRKRQHEVSHYKLKKNKSATREIQLVPFEIPSHLSIQFRAKSFK